MWARSLGLEDPLEEEMATHPVFLLGKSHGQRSLADYSPQGCKELDTIDNHSFTGTLELNYPFRLVPL